METTVAEQHTVHPSKFYYFYIAMLVFFSLGLLTTMVLVLTGKF